MTSREIFLSFIVGVASGIISSMLVTIFYRIKDSEKDRQAFFVAVNEYVRGLTYTSIDGSRGLIYTSTDEVKTMYTFMSSHPFPRIYKWIRLTKTERIIILELYKYVSNLQDLLIDYHSSILEISDQVLSDSITREEALDALKKKYLPYILSIRISIISMSAKIELLGNKKALENMKKSEEIALEFIKKRKRKL